MVEYTHDAFASDGVHYVVLMKKELPQLKPSPESRRYFNFLSAKADDGVIPYEEAVVIHNVRIEAGFDDRDNAVELVQEGWIAPYEGGIIITL